MYDFVAIGDTVVDAFIKLINASVDKEREHLTLAFGDKIPYQSVEEIFAVGNSANASVVASRLGLKTALVTYLGDDDNGKKCLAKLEEEKVSAEFVSIEQGKQTNYHFVLWYEDDRTILVKHEEYKRTLLGIGRPKWLYLSSLGGDTMIYHSEIIEFLKNNTETNLAFQPGTFQISLGEKLGDIYKRTKIFFCNVEEAEEILHIDTLGTKELLKRMKALGPEIVVITDGPKGAYAYDGVNFYNQPPYPDPKPPFERTGAGDAFSSTVVASLALGNNLPIALKWGAINSMSVVQEVGAQKGLLNRSKLEEYLKNAPDGFNNGVLV